MQPVPFEVVLEAQRKYQALMEQYWQQANVNSLPWWILLVISVGSWAAWWYLADRRRILELFAFGSIVAMLSIVIDTIGVNLFLWTYPVNIAPSLTPALYPLDFAAAPAAFMLVYQWAGESRSRYIVLMTVTALIFSFVLEPLMMLLGIFRNLQWNSFYSVPVWLFVGIVPYWAIRRLRDLW